jgi:hypothetical protein
VVTQDHPVHSEVVALDHSAVAQEDHPVVVQAHSEVVHPTQPAQFPSEENIPTIKSNRDIYFYNDRKFLQYGFYDFS